MQEDFESAFSPAAWREVQQRQRFCSGIQSYRLVIAIGRAARQQKGRQTVSS
jgi:hypothetical protein